MKQILRLILIFWLATSAKVTTQAQEKPNVLFVYIDDLGWKDLSCYGSDFYETPAIDELAEDGVRFTSAYQAAPKSVPSRASLFTGKYHERTEIWDSEGVRLSEYTFGEAFKDAGYHTYFAGKWHLGKNDNRYPDDQGFDVNKAGCEWGAPNGSSEGGGRYFSPYDCPTLSNGPEGEYLTDRLTDETLTFIEDHEKNQPDQPFFACLFHYAVHTPIEAPYEAYEPYIQKKQDMDYHLPRRIYDGPAQTKLRQDNEVYAGMIAKVDESVRLLRDKLDSLGISDNTIIIFSSDHGGLSTTLKSKGRELATSNYPLRTGKGWLYEGGIRSPLIIYWPGHNPEGMVTDEQVVNTDFYPTMLEMAGIQLKPDQHKDGESFAPLLEGKDWHRSQPIFWYFPRAKTGSGNPNMQAVRKEDHKLLHYPLQDRYELYNLEKDLGENHDLTREKPELTEELKNVLFDWKSHTDLTTGYRESIEYDYILPEYDMDLEEDHLPDIRDFSLEVNKQRNRLVMHCSISKSREKIHPVNLFFYYRGQPQDEWSRIYDLEGQTGRIIKEEQTVTWDYSSLADQSIDLKMVARIDNALYPEKLAEKIIRGVSIEKTDFSLPVPEGRRLREIVSDHYTDTSLMIGATTGSWAFGKPNGRLMDQEFNYVTPENDFKQSKVRPDSSSWDWSRADAWLKHIIDQDQILRIHAPIGPQCADWIKEDHRTAGELARELDTFMTALCRRYNGNPRIPYLDVVNETVTREGDWKGPRPGTDKWENPWTQMGYETDIPAEYSYLDSVPLYIIRAFEVANKHAPDLKLVLNQHGGMEQGMWDKIKDLVLYLRNERGLRIDALGWQAHVDAGWETEEKLTRLRQLIDWAQNQGMEFHITEFDAYIRGPEPPTLLDQANTYQAVMEILVDKSANGTIGWNTWHVSDAAGYKTERRAAMFDEHFQAKPAYYAVQRTLERGVDSTLKEVTFRIWGRNQADSTWLLDGALIQAGDLSALTSDSGRASMKAKDGFNYLVKKKGYHSMQSSVEVMADTLIEDTLSRKYHQAEIILKDAANQAPVEGVWLSLDGNEQTTSASGAAIYTGVAHGGHQLRVRDSVFNVLKNILVVSDTTLTISLDSTRYRTSLEIYDKRTGSSVSLAQVTCDDQIQETGSQGETQYALTYGGHDYLIEADGFLDERGQLTVHSDTAKKIGLTPSLAQVEFSVYHEDNPLNDASVEFDGKSKTTNQLGTCEFTGIPLFEKYIYNISREGYQTYNDTALIESDTTIRVNLAEVIHHAEFQVSDYYTGQGIEGCRIVVDTGQQKTDSAGVAVFPLTQGLYDFEITPARYADTAGSVVIQSDTSFFFKLRPAQVTARFEVTDGTEAISDAEIQMNGTTHETDMSGIASFSGLVAEANYNYQIAKEGFNSMDSSLYALYDTTLVVQLSEVTGFEYPRRDGMVIYPIPAANQIHVHSDEPMNHIRLMDLSGKILLTEKPGDKNRCSLSSFGLDSGCYILEIQTNNKGVIRRKVLVEGQ